MSNNPSNLQRILNNPILQTLVIFISGGWIVLEILEYAIDNFGLHESARKILLIILLSLLPIALFLAWFATRRKGVKKKQTAHAFSIKRRWILIPAMLIVIAIALSTGFRLHHNSKIEHALEYTLPNLQNDLKAVTLSDGLRNWKLFEQTNKLNRILRDHPDYHKIRNRITTHTTITSDPAGASVFAAAYSDPDATWHLLGKTPLQEVVIPGGLSKIKIEKPGYVTIQDTYYTPFGWDWIRDPSHYTLHKREEIPAGMVFAAGFHGNRLTLGDGNSDVVAGDFWIDQYEVTNAAYITFVDSGGYESPSYWKIPFIEGEDTLDWETAMDRFTDQTGWQGPAAWIMGDFPKGEEELPVSGISWFEAAAFANFVKKELPTIYHWTYLSELQAAPELSKFGNFLSNAPSAVGSLPCMTRFGTYDLPGNVSEWIYNASKDRRTIRGSNFQEPPYFHNNTLYISPWTRKEIIGFRCMRFINDTLRQELMSSISRPLRDFSAAETVSDEVFEVFKKSYAYEKGELNPETVARKDTTDWLQEIVVVEVPYEESNMQINVFLPKNSTPPYQTVVYFPHAGSFISKSMDELKMIPKLKSYLKSGRAVVWPIYYGTYGRGKIKANDYQTFRLRNIYDVIDFQITCDYLQNRSDIDQQKLAYFGSSMGSSMAPFVLAIESRIKVGILSAFGASNFDQSPEMDHISYLPRIKIPMLMMNGKYDYLMTLNHQQAFYDFLGTPEKDKVWKSYEFVHGTPFTEYVNESLAWLDKYFGPVKLKQEAK